MKITNKGNLPLGLVRAIENDPYSSGGADITASTLADPPLLQALKRKYEAELEEDASDRIWALLGQAAHVVMERGSGKTPGVEAETRLSMDVLGWKVSGAFDHFDLTSGVLSDLKVTSAWTIVYGDRLPDWEKQLNVLAHLVNLRKLEEATAIEVIAILRDWGQRDVDRVEDYPKSAVVVVPLKLWPFEKRQAYIEERVKLHQEARQLAELDLDGTITPCTDEERWMKTDKKGVKTYVRCGKYCPCAPVCSVLKREKAEAA